jgi:TM2 domain-containing membrane protein YozV
MNYHYMDGKNQEIGPVSLENLKSLRLAGIIKDHTLVRAENEELWVTAMSEIRKMEALLPPKTKAAVESPEMPAVGMPVSPSPSSKAPLEPPALSPVKTLETQPPANKAVQSPTTFSQSEMIRFEAEKKSAGLAFVLCWILGNFGAHRFYLNKPHAVTKLVITLISIPLILLFCIGYIGILAMSIWTIVDLFYISGWVKEYNTALLTKIQSGQS